MKIHPALPVVAVLAAGPVRAQCEQWSLLHSPGLDPIVKTLVVLVHGSGPEVWAGGDFLQSGTTPIRGVARWSGSAWTDVGFTDRGVESIAVFDDGSGPKVYAVSSGYHAEDHGLHVWDGASTWTHITRTGDVLAYDDGNGEALYAQATSFGFPGITAYGLARYDGTSWSALGLLPGSSLSPEVVWDDGSGATLCLVGRINTGGALTGFYVYRYDGAAFVQLGAEFDKPVLDLAVHEGELYACGDFQTYNGLPATEVVRWTGHTWASLPPTGASNQVVAIVSHDAADGRGPLLYAGGAFSKIGGVQAKRLARWNGQQWEALPASVDKAVNSLASLDDGTGSPSLFAGGWMTLAGGAPSLHVAELQNICACQGTSYCTAGTTANGCTALVSSSGTASRSAASGFDVTVAGSEGGGPGVIFFGTNGEQALPWGNGTSVRCVVPPLVRTGLDPGTGTPGQCDGGFALDFNAWMNANPLKAPPGGASAYLQCWFRDPQNTSNQVTSFSDALRFAVCP